MASNPAVAGEEPSEGDVALATLIEGVSVARLRRGGLMRRCLDALVTPARLCRAFERTQRDAPWADSTMLGVALRGAIPFADADAALQRYMGATPPHAEGPSHVAHCGCVRARCPGRPCASGWMRRIGRRARLRLVAWRWIESHAVHYDGFRGFYERELCQCAASDIGTRYRGPHEGRRAGAAASHPTEDGAPRQDDRRRSAGPNVDEPMVLSCTASHVLSMCDARFYEAAVREARASSPPIAHPTEGAIRGHTKERASGLVERWAMVDGDAFVVRVTYSPT